MAQNPATVTAEGEATTAVAEPAKPKNTVPIMLAVPPALKEVLEAKAKEADLPVSSYVRREIAKLVDYQGPWPTATRNRKGKYTHITDPEARKAAMLADQKAARDDVKALLAAVKAGKVDMETIRRQFGGAEAAPATA